MEKASPVVDPSLLLLFITKCQYCSMLYYYSIIPFYILPYCDSPDVNVQWVPIMFTESFVNSMSVQCAVCIRCVFTSHKALHHCATPSGVFNCDVTNTSQLMKQNNTSWPSSDITFWVESGL